MTRLLSRYAESIFWLARYMERAENLARILEVQETFARDSQGSHDWGTILSINADWPRFLERHQSPSADAVLHFYVLDRTNPTSITSNLHAARENGRAVRPVISTEIWVHLNVFYNRVAALKPREVAEDRITRFCGLIKEGCDAHAGITAGTCYRDEAWAFYRLGAAIECADQTTRLVDAKFLSVEARGDVDPGSAADISYWTALLRSVAGYQAFRRVHPRSMNPQQVATFILGDPSFPRSVAHNLRVIEGQLTNLRRQYRLRAAAAALEHVDGLRDDLEPTKVRMAVERGELHRFNDFLQRGLIELTDITARSFFS